MLYVLTFSDTSLTPEDLSSKWTFAIISLITNYLIIFPLSLAENLHEFRYISIIALVAIFYVALILLIQLPEFYKANYRPGIIVTANW